MFDVGFLELSLIGIIALLVVGPEKLPGLARTVGTWLGQARRMATNFRMELERELELSELKRLNQRIDIPDLDTFAQPQSKHPEDPKTAASAEQVTQADPAVPRTEPATPPTEQRAEPDG